MGEGKRRGERHTEKQMESAKKVTGKKVELALFLFTQSSHEYQKDSGEQSWACNNLGTTSQRPGHLTTVSHLRLRFNCKNPRGT